MKANSRPHSESRWIDQDRRQFFDIRLRLLRSIRAVAVSVVFASAPRGCGATVESRASDAGLKSHHFAPETSVFVLCAGPLGDFRPFGCRRSQEPLSTYAIKKPLKISRQLRTFLLK
jgi:hypothetical protein